MGKYMEKEKLIKIAKKLHQEAFDANAYYLIMQQYKECHSRYINELNISPAFYSVVYEALQKACFMEKMKWMLRMHIIRLEIICRIFRLCLFIMPSV